jgi:uncharacterized protein (TIGR03067 family)
MRTLLLVSVLAIAVPDRQDPNIGETRPFEEQLVGQWQVVKRVNSGRDDPNLGGLHMLFKRDSMQHLLNNGSQPAALFPFTLDAMKRPATLTFRGNEKAIVKIEGDHMTLSIGTAGQNFPANFVSTPGSNVTQLELLRVKK